MTLHVYLSGEIHTDWRDQIIDGAAGLDVVFTGPVTDHAASDDCGVAILGAEENKFWHDRKGAQLNAIRTRKGIEEADVVVVRFGDQYKQWNAAFDAGYAAALGKSLVIPAWGRPRARAERGRRRSFGCRPRARAGRANPALCADGHPARVSTLCTGLRGFRLCKGENRAYPTKTHRYLENLC